MIVNVSDGVDDTILGEFVTQLRQLKYRSTEPGLLEHLIETETSLAVPSPDIRPGPDLGPGRYKFTLVKCQHYDSMSLGIARRLLSILGSISSTIFITCSDVAGSL